MSGLFTELKRRNVFRVAAAYAVAGWLLTEVASVVFPIFGAPDWVLRILVLLLAVGFPLALGISWVYELTPDGLKRESDVQRDNSITGHTGRKLDLATLFMVVVAIGFVLFVRLVWKPEAPGQGTSARQTDTAPMVEITIPADIRQSVAVLPFVNMSDDQDNEYFSDGISEELLNVLVKVEDLRVPSRTSSFRFKNSDLGITDIAAELEVDHILEGSVRKAGNQVRVTAQLIEVSTDTHLWSETYTRTLDDIFVIQDEISQAIVAALKVTLGAGTQLATSNTRDTEAYNHYLRGRFFWHQRTEAGFASAEQDLRAAVELDPTYGDAWSALADIYVLQPEYAYATIDDAIPKSRAALERALTINAESARALTTRAYLRFLYEQDYHGAEKDFRDAIDIEPGYATAHQWFGEFLAAMRRYDEAIAANKKAFELDPLAPIMPHVIANTLAFAGRLDESVEYYDKSLELMPEWFNALVNLSVVRMRQGRLEESRDLTRRFERSLGREPGTFDYVDRVIDAKKGEISREEAIQAVLESPNATCYAFDQPTYLALLEAWEQALDVLEACYDEDPYTVHINGMGYMDPIRDHPRFQGLLDRLKVPVEFRG